MPQYTENYKIIKPNIEEHYDIVNIDHENADIIDNEIKNVNNRVDKVESELYKPLYQKTTTYDSVVSNPPNTTNGQVSVTLKGNTYNQALFYDRNNYSNSWKGYGDAEININSIVINSSGWSNRCYIKLDLSKFNSGGKYGLILKANRIENYLYVSELFETNIRVGVKQGYNKFILNDVKEETNFLSFYISSSFTEPFEMEDIRFIELNSEIEQDFETMSADQLAQKYQYITGIKSTIGSARISSADDMGDVKDRAYVTAVKDNKIVNLRSLPNGIKDEIRVSGGKLVKRVEQVVFDNESVKDWTYVFSSGNGSHVLYKQNWSIDNNSVYPSYPGIIHAIARDELHNWRITWSIPDIPQDVFGVAFHSNGNLYLVFSGEYISNNYTPDKQGCINYLEDYPLTLTYQLAEPEIIPLDIKPLEVFPGGTIYIEPYIKDKFVVDSTKTIDLQYPIVRIDKLLKLDVDGITWKEVEGTLSDDGKTIIVTEEGTYEVYGEIRPEYSTLGEKTFTFPVNLKSQVNSNADAIKQIGNKIYADADLFTAMLLQQEMRLTLLEEG